MKINLDNKKFRALENSDNGEVSNGTIFYYHQDNNIVWASYSGGDIIKGFLVGKIVNDLLTFSYQHVNKNLEIMTGNCQSQPKVNEQNKITLYENWEWTCRDFSKGSSVLIEI